MSQEDVWPTWLQNYITRNMRGYNLGQIIFNFPDTVTEFVESITRRNGDPRIMRVRCVCQPCNSGWMGRLQNLAKPLLVQLMNGEKIELEPQQQRTVAAWAAMSVMSAEFRFPNKVAISYRDRQHLRETGGPPDNWKIWIGNFNRERWKTWHAHHNLLMLEGDERPNIVDGKAAPIEVINGHSRFFNTQTTTFVLEKLYILAYSSEIPDVFENMTFTAGGVPTLLPIWPRRTDNMTWPPAVTMTDADADFATGYIYETFRRMNL
jgi:hypothetical protein